MRPWTPILCGIFGMQHITSNGDVPLKVKYSEQDIKQQYLNNKAFGLKWRFRSFIVEIYDDCLFFFVSNTVLKFKVMPILCGIFGMQHITSNGDVPLKVKYSEQDIKQQYLNNKAFGLKWRFRSFIVEIYDDCLFFYVSNTVLKFKVFLILLSVWYFLW